MKFKSGFFGFLLGGLTGAAIAFLVAPQSGDETRQMLVENSQKMREDALDSIQATQERAIDSLNKFQTKVEAGTDELSSLIKEIIKTQPAEEIDVLGVSRSQKKETVSA